VRVISFDAPKRWKKELDEHVGVAGKAATGTGVPTVLLANKCDMLGDRAIPKEALDKVADESGFFKWFETSAKTGPLARSSLQFILHRALRFAAVRCAASLIGFNLPSDMFTRGVVHRSFA
jgi:GTPase SAR1 family protein